MNTVISKTKKNYVKFCFGLLFILLGQIFWYEETKYFGFNELPSCKMEGLCDMASMLINSFGIYLIFTAHVTHVTVIYTPIE